MTNNTITRETKLAYAQQIKNELNHYDYSCDPEEFLIDLQIDIEIALEEKFGESEDNCDIASEAIYGPDDFEENI